MNTRLFLVCLASGLLAAQANDWYRWRGPDLNGISKETGWTSQWPDEGPPILWRAQVGLGFSSVVISEGRLFTMGNQDDTDTVFCFNAETGKKEWSFSYPCATNPKYYQGGTSSTPTVDGERVYSLSREGHLFCCRTMDGNTLWSRRLTNDFNLQLSDWGFGGSPLVWGERLILNAGHHGLALNKTDGRLLWKSGPDPAGYATPVPFHAFGRPAVLIFAAKSLVAVDLKNGQISWEFPWETHYDVNAPDPVIAGEQVFISSGYRKGGALLSAGRGKPAVVWASQNMHNQLNASILIDGHLYGISGQNGHGGELRCVELRTAKINWSEPSIGLGALMAADGKLIISSEKGELIIAAATPDSFRPLARAQALGGVNWTTPVLANGRIYCRNSKGDLVCLDVRSPRTAQSQ